MTYSLTGATVSSTYGRLVQVILGTPNTYYDGFGNLLDIGSSLTSSIGPTGPTGPTGPAGDSIVWNGVWDSMMVYFPLDIVSYNGSSYIRVTSPTGSAPFTPPDIDTTNWNLIVEKGATGPTGPYPFYFQNTTPTGSISEGSFWYDSDLGNLYVYVDDGSSQQWVTPIGLIGPTGPQGEIGPTGTQGEVGATGATGPQGIQGEIGATGPTGPQGQKGPKGQKGTKGQKGAKGQIGTQ